MELSTIRKIVEINSPRATDRVNAYLALGWVLLQTSSMTTDHSEYSEPHIKYSLGWPHDGEPKEPPRAY